MSDPTDPQLLERWRAGDRSAGDALFGRHFRAVFRFLRTKVDDDVAEELTQSVFLGVVQGKDNAAQRASVRAYLFAVARNQLAMHFRRGRVRDRVIELGTHSVEDLGASPRSLAAAQQEQALLLSALRRLPLDQQMAVELYYWEDLSTAELAEILDVAEGTVRSRMARARQRLGELIEQLAADPELAQRTLSGFESWARNLRGHLDR